MGWIICVKHWMRQTKKPQNIHFYTETRIVISLELLQISDNWRAYEFKSFHPSENGFYCNSELMASWQLGKHPQSEGEWMNSQHIAGLFFPFTR